MGSNPACGQQQRGQQRQRWRARPAAARPVHSSSRGGAGGSLAARRTSTGSPRAPGHFVLPQALAGHRGGLCKTLCPSDLLPRLRSAAPDLGARLLPVLRSSPASAGPSVPGSLYLSSAPCVSGSLLKSVPCARGCGLGAHSVEAPPALRDLSSRPTCHFPPTPQPSAPVQANGRGGPRPGSQRPLLPPPGPAPSKASQKVATAPPVNPSSLLPSTSACWGPATDVDGTLETF